MRLVVFGANGPTGRLVTTQALAAGHAVTAVTRHPETFLLRNNRLQILRGNVFDRAAVEHAVAGHDAVLSTLGVPFSRHPITLYSQGMAHIVEAMLHAGVRRVICVSLSATVPHADPEGGWIFEHILQPFFIRVVGRTLYADMRRMETLVMHSQLDWTIVRPAGLFATPAVTPYHVSEGHIRGRFTSRADLADCMLNQLTTNQYVHKAVAVATVAVKPNMLKLLWSEGITKTA
jgi:putative NADH-flavin reductase